MNRLISLLFCLQCSPTHIWKRFHIFQKKQLLAQGIYCKYAVLKIISSVNVSRCHIYSPFRNNLLLPFDSFLIFVKKILDIAFKLENQKGRETPTFHWFAKKPIELICKSPIHRTGSTGQTNPAAAYHLPYT